MLATRSAVDVLNREFLEVRCKLLELAAALDRLDRASGSVADDARMAKVAAALQVIQASGHDRAEQLQLIFSRPYDAQWRREFQLP